MRLLCDPVDVVDRITFFRIGFAEYCRDSRGTARFDNGS